MMGAGHVKMSAALWLAGCALADLVGAGPGAEVAVIGGAVCAGAALWNDIDHDQSTVANSAGPLSQLASKAIVALSRQVYLITRTARDWPNRDPHRTLTHTWPWALACGLVVSVIAHAAPLWAAAVLVYAVTQLGIRSALPWGWRWWWVNVSGVWKFLFGRRWYRLRLLRRNLRVPVPAVCGLALAGATWRWADGGDWWLGAAVAIGMLLHDLGDAMTNSAVPLAWPIPIRGQRWCRVGLPRWMRFDTGGEVEMTLVQPAFLVLGAVAGVYLAWPLGAAAVEAVQAALG